jgi:Mg-chelatase subunit ChlI
MKGVVEIEGVSLHLAHPDEFPINWVGQDEVMRQLLAAWLVVDPQDLPMNPRLLGKPGVGKTTLVRHFTRALPPRVRVLWGACDPLSTPAPRDDHIDMCGVAKR